MGVPQPKRRTAPSPEFAKTPPPPNKIQEIPIARYWQTAPTKPRGPCQIIKYASGVRVVAMESRYSQKAMVHFRDQMRLHKPDLIIIENPHCQTPEVRYASDMARANGIELAEVLFDPYQRTIIDLALIPLEQAIMAILIEENRYAPLVNSMEVIENATKKFRRSILGLSELFGPLSPTLILQAMVKLKISARKMREILRNVSQRPGGDLEPFMEECDQTIYTLLEVATDLSWYRLKRLNPQGKTLVLCPHEFSAIFDPHYRPVLKLNDIEYYHYQVAMEEERSGREKTPHFG